MNYAWRNIHTETVSYGDPHNWGNPDDWEQVLVMTPEFYDNALEDAFYDGAMSNR